MTSIGASIQVLYAGRLEYLTTKGFDITVVCTASERDEAIRARGVRLKTFEFARAITPLKDIRVFVQLYRFFRAERFDLVEVATPKAALIGSLAAWLAGCRRVIHVLHGAPYEGKRGLMGATLRAAVSIPCRLAHVTFAVSASLGERVCADGLAKRNRVRVFAGGANGVDVTRFSQEKTAVGKSLREAHHISADTLVIGFVGRITRDKGLEELTQAFEAIHKQFCNTVLLVVGPYEDRDRPSRETCRLLSNHPAVRHVGLQHDIVPFMSAMDIFVLPTYREGLPTVLLEAAAAGIPTITTTATGARDAIVADKTGLQVPVGDPVALRQALERLIRDASLRAAMGQAGRGWVSERFDQKSTWQQQVEEYQALAGSAQPPRSVSVRSF